MYTQLQDLTIHTMRSYICVLKRSCMHKHKRSYAFSRMFACSNSLARTYKFQTSHTFTHTCTFACRPTFSCTHMLPHPSYHGMIQLHARMVFNDRSRTRTRSIACLHTLVRALARPEGKNQELTDESRFSLLLAAKRACLHACLRASVRFCVRA